MKFRERFVQELRAGLLRRMENGQSLLPDFMDQLEHALPPGASWLRLERAPWWESVEVRRFDAGSEVKSISTMPKSGPRELWSWVAAGCYDGKIHVWDVETRKHIATLEGHTSAVTSVSFSPDGDQVLSGSWDKTVRLWSLAQGHEKLPLRVFEGHSAGVFSVSFSPMGDQVASGTWDNTVRVWSLDKGSEKLPLVFNWHSNWANSVSFSPAGDQVASGSSDNTVRVWCLATARCLTVFECPGSVMALRWDPKVPGRLAAACVVGDHHGKFPLAFFFTSKTPI